MATNLRKRRAPGLAVGPAAEAGEGGRAPKRLAQAALPGDPASLAAGGLAGEGVRHVGGALVSWARGVGGRAPRGGCARP